MHQCLRMANTMLERPIVLSEGQVKANDERPSDEPVVSLVMLVDTSRENAQVVLDALDRQTCDSGVKCGEVLACWGGEGVLAEAEEMRSEK